MIYLGATKIGRMFLGGTEIAKAYLGSDLVFQKGGQPQPVEHTLTVLLSSYDSTDKSYYNITGVSNAYLDPDTNSSTSSVCGVVMKRGSNAETWCYFKFDTSALPADATIVSVACKARTGISTTSTTYVTSKGCVMCSGTTVKTPSITVSNNGYLRSFETGNWTLEELRDVRVKLYGTRGTTNTSSNYALRMYGAELTIVYTTPS